MIRRPHNGSTYMRAWEYNNMRSGRTQSNQPRSGSGRTMGPHRGGGGAPAVGGAQVAGRWPVLQQRPPSCALLRRWDMTSAAAAPGPTCPTHPHTHLHQPAAAVLVQVGDGEAGAGGRQRAADGLHKARDDAHEGGLAAAVQPHLQGAAPSTSARSECSRRGGGGARCRTCIDCALTQEPGAAAQSKLQIAVPCQRGLCGPGPGEALAAFVHAANKALMGCCALPPPRTHIADTRASNQAQQQWMTSDSSMALLLQTYDDR